MKLGSDVGPDDVFDADASRFLFTLLFVNEKLVRL